MLFFKEIRWKGYLIKSVPDLLTVVQECLYLLYYVRF